MGVALKALRCRFVTHRPFVLSHLLTARCNADCATCLWKMPANSRTDEMSTDEVTALYREAAAAGFGSLVMWGGEPMIRRDVGPLLHAARMAGLATTLITNGWWLDERADEVFPSLGRLLLSIDGVGELHDRIRRCPGLFERLDRGLSRVRRDFPRVRVLVLAVVSSLNAAYIEDIARYCAEKGVRLLFQSMNTTDYGFADRPLQDVAIAGEQQLAVAQEIQRLRKKGYPVRDSSAYLDSLGDAAYRYRCHYKKVVLRVEPNGDILDCTRTAAPLANARRDKLRAFVASPSFTDFVRRSETCNRCRDAGVIESSHIWDGRISALWNAIRTLD